MNAEDNTFTVIGPDAQINGNMNFTRSAKILGSVEGTISAGEELHVGDTAHCVAELHAANIIIDGRVEGNVKATDSIQLKPKCRVTGDLIANRLVVADGAKLRGNVIIGDDSVDVPEPITDVHVEVVDVKTNGKEK